MKHERALELVAALRSGLYKQDESALHRVVDGQATFCCLGVSCDLAFKAGATERSEGIVNSGCGRIQYGDIANAIPNVPFQIHCGYLPNNVRLWMGMSNHTGRRADKAPIDFSEFAVGDYIDAPWGIEGRKYDSLANANDSGVPFSAIASYIEKYWQSL